MEAREHSIAQGRFEQRISRLSDDRVCVSGSCVGDEGVAVAGATIGAGAFAFAEVSLSGAEELASLVVNGDFHVFRDVQLAPLGSCFRIGGFSDGRGFLFLGHSIVCLSVGEGDKFFGSDKRKDGHFGKLVEIDNTRFSVIFFCAKSSFGREFCP